MYISGGTQWDTWWLNCGMEKYLLFKGRPPVLYLLSNITCLTKRQFFNQSFIVHVVGWTARRCPPSICRALPRDGPEKDITVATQVSTSPCLSTHHITNITWPLAVLTRLYFRDNSATLVTYLTYGTVPSALWCTYTFEIPVITVQYDCHRHYSRVMLDRNILLCVPANLHLLAHAYMVPCMHFNVYYTNPFLG